MIWINESGLDNCDLFFKNSLPITAIQVNLYPLRAELAVMDIFSDGRTAPRDALPMDAVSGLWRRYGLRDHDLPRAMERLLELGLIEVKPMRGHQAVVLTDRGTQWLRSAVGRLSRLLLIPRYLRKRMSALLRVSPSASPSPQRRGDDLPVAES